MSFIRYVHSFSLRIEDYPKILEIFKKLTITMKTDPFKNETSTPDLQTAEDVDSRNKRWRWSEAPIQFGGLHSAIRNYHFMGQFQNNAWAISFPVLISIFTVKPEMLVPNRKRYPIFRQESEWSFLENKVVNFIFYVTILV